MIEKLKKTQPGEDNVSTDYIFAFLENVMCEFKNEFVWHRIHVKAGLTIAYRHLMLFSS